MRGDQTDVPVSHPEKVLFPDSGITKGELCSYYAAIADVMLPHVRGRPITMERYPAGITKKGFVQKDVSKGLPAWLERVEVAKKGSGEEGAVVHYPLATDARSLIWLANQNSITPHVWASRVPKLDHPDLCLFDLDPPEDDQSSVHAAALAVRDVLDELGLPSYVKTSGSKGFHIAIPLGEDADFESTWQFAHGVGALLVKRHPDRLTQEFFKSDRAGRLFVDTGRNAPSATFAATYAVRARPGAPVSAPCTWQEVADRAVGPRTFTLRTISDRMARVGDLWRDIHRDARSLRSALTALHQRLTEADWKEAWAASTRRPTSRHRNKTKGD